MKTYMFEVSIFVTVTRLERIQWHQLLDYERNIFVEVTCEL